MKNVIKFILRKFNGGIKRVIIFFYQDAFVMPELIKNNDPEGIFLYPYCKGLGIDVGCGSKKTHPNAIGIDITPRGRPGKNGSEKKRLSEADICLSGDNLYIFADEVFDYVVSRHNLEHYQHPIKALKEWKRVLRKGGILGVVLPDNEALDTMKLDPTHKHVFTKESFRGIIDALGGFEIIKLDECIPRWSFVCIARKIKKD